MDFPKNRALSHLQLPSLATLQGIGLVALIAGLATGLSHIPTLALLSISPLVIGIVLGLFYASTLRPYIPASWGPGIIFSGKRLLRIGVVLYGFRLTFQEIADVGTLGLLSSVIIVTTTLLVGSLIGMKVLKLDRETSLLIAAGSAICGAAAVLAAETVLKSEKHKGAIAVGTVVIFGTLSLFLYPALYSMNLLPLTVDTYGVFIGSSVHEVAQVVAAGSAVAGAGQTAVVVKMTRVMLLTPVLLILGIAINRQNGPLKIQNLIPWFAVGFTGAVAFNSFQILPNDYVQLIHKIDTFLLTMAMTALGMETRVDKFKTAGLKPLTLAAFLFIWLFATSLAVVNFF